MAAYGGQSARAFLHTKQQMDRQIPGQTAYTKVDTQTNWQTKRRTDIVKPDTQTNWQTKRWTEITNWTHKQIDRQKDGQTDYSNFNIDVDIALHCLELLGIAYFRGKYFSFFAQIPGGTILKNGGFGEGFLITKIYFPKIFPSFPGLPEFFPVCSNFPQMVL